MNICMKEKHTHEHREQTCGFQGRENWGRDGVRDWVGDINQSTWTGLTSSHCRAQRNIFRIL